MILIIRIIVHLFDNKSGDSILDLGAIPIQISKDYGLSVGWRRGAGQTYYIAKEGRSTA